MPVRTCVCPHGHAARSRERGRETATERGLNSVQGLQLRAVAAPRVDVHTSLLPWGGKGGMERPLGFSPPKLYVIFS